MKQLFTLIFIIVAGCSDDEANPKQTYPDLTGTWKFDLPDIKGTFQIEKSGNEFTISTGTYRVIGQDIIVETGIVEQGSGRKLSRIVLLNPSGGIVFQDMTYTTAHNELSGVGYSFSYNCTNSCVDVIKEDTFKIRR